MKNIKEIQDNPVTYALAQGHVAFGNDGCGNTIWMELSNRIIKVFYHEYELDQGLINIVPSLVDFCNSLQNWTLQ